MNDPGDGARRVDRDAYTTSLQEHAQALVLPDWPVFALADPDPPGWLAGASEENGALLSIRLDHRPPDGRERLVVQTQPDDGQQPDLLSVVAQFPEPEGHPLRLGRSALGAGRAPRRTADVLIGDRAVPANFYRHGVDAVWSVVVREVLVVVAASDVELGRPALTEVTDLGPYQRERALVVERLLSRGAG